MMAKQKILDFFVKNLIMPTTYFLYGFLLDISFIRNGTILLDLNSFFSQKKSTSAKVIYEHHFQHNLILKIHITRLILSVLINLHLSIHNLLVI